MSRRKLCRTSVPLRLWNSGDIDPGYDWSRAIPAPGHSAVDFEERVNFRRLHEYRLSRTRLALQELVEHDRRVHQIGEKVGNAGFHRIGCDRSVDFRHRADNCPVEVLIEIVDPAIVPLKRILVLVLRQRTA